jgi:hypothetical protein
MVPSGHQQTEKLESQQTDWPFSNASGPLTTAALLSPTSVPISFIRRKDYRSTPIYREMVSHIIPADPLRYSGERRLKDYLKICWELLVRLGVLCEN